MSIVVIRHAESEGNLQNAILKENNLDNEEARWAQFKTNP